jgi:hypothetical protein
MIAPCNPAGKFRTCHLGYNAHPLDPSYLKPSIEKAILIFIHSCIYPPPPATFQTSKGKHLFQRMTMYFYKKLHTAPSKTTCMGEAQWKSLSSIPHQVMEYQNDFPTMGITPHEIQHAIWELPHGKLFGKDYTIQTLIFFYTHQSINTCVILLY